MLKSLFGAAAMACVLMASTVDAATEASYTVERFEWTVEEGCVAVGNDARQREVITGVGYAECQSVISLKDVQIDYTRAENGAGYLVRIVSNQLSPFTCWYNADGKPAVCQDQ